MQPVCLMGIVMLQSARLGLQILADKAAVGAPMIFSLPSKCSLPVCCLGAAATGCWAEAETTVARFMTVILCVLLCAG